MTFASRADMLAYAAELSERAIRDKSYQETGIGQVVARYLEQRLWRGLSPATLKRDEFVLAKFALFFAHKEIEAFTGSAGERLLSSFLSQQWPPGASAENSRREYLQTLKTFFRWATYNDLMHKDPTQYMKFPKVGERDSDLYSEAERELLISRQPRLRDRVALMLLFDLSLRCGESEDCHLDSQNPPGRVTLDLRLEVSIRRPDWCPACRLRLPSIWSLRKPRAGRFQSSCSHTQRDVPERDGQ